MEPIKVSLSTQAEEKLKENLDTFITGTRSGLKALHETNLPEWRRIYEATPLEASRSFPFENASNLVVPLAGIHCDTLKAQVMSAVWRTRPLWMVDVVGDFEGQAEPLREAWQRFTLHNAIEPEELDLYRVESEWIGEIIKYGTSFIKVPYEKIWEDWIVPAGDGTGSYGTMRELIYKGPRPEKLCLEDAMFPANLRSLKGAPFFAHRIKYQKHELMERRYTGFFEPSKVDKILKSPTRTSPHSVQLQRENDANIKSPTSGYAEWDVYECWLPWRAPNQKKAPRIIAWYSQDTGQLLNCVYDQYTPLLGTPPFVVGKLLQRDDSLYGYGLCEILSALQEEVSQIHNQRRDNATVANTKVWRVSPDSKLHEGYKIFPSAMLPADKDEIEPLAHGEISPTSIQEEQLSIELAEKRSGVSPPQQGAGSGSNTKKGVYTAMGTMSLLQEGNGRKDLTVADVRNAHTKLGRVISYEYAHMGLDERKLTQFGKLAPLIQKAAELIRERKMALPISSSTASINKEVEKQNDLMLSQIVARHYMSVTQLMMQLGNSMLPDQVKAYSAKVIEASEKLMKQILRNFDHDDVDAMVPKALPEQAGGGQQGGQGAAPGQAPQGASNTIQFPVQPRTQESAGVLAGMVGGGEEFGSEFK